MAMDLISACSRFVDCIPDNLNYITPEELQNSMNEESGEIFLLDIRDKESFKRSHIKGAINIFLRELFKPENLSLLPKNKKIIICCWVGHTASQILTLLQLLGYDAIGLKYGMGVSAKVGEIQKGWLELDLPIVSGNENS